MDVNYGDYYHVFPDGRIYSNYSNQFLSTRKDKDGYLILNVVVDGVNKTKRLHRILLEVYNPNENSDSLTVNHKDGNKLNNSLDNLEWMTNEENIHHANINGLINVKNDKNPMSKLSSQEVDEIITLYNTTLLSQEEIGRKFNIAQSAVSKIVNGKRRTDNTVIATGNSKRKVSKYDQETINNIIEMYLNGTKQKDIAAANSVSISTVERAISKYKQNKL